MSQGSFFHEQMSRPVRRIAWSWCLPSRALRVDCQWQKLFSVWSAWWLITSPSWEQRNKVRFEMRHRGLACSLSAQMLTYHAKRTKIHHSALGCFMPYTLVWIKKSCSFEDECVIEIVQIIYRYKTVYLYKYTVQSLSELLKTRHFNFSFISLYNGSLNCFNMFQTILT